MSAPIYYLRYGNLQIPGSTTYRTREDAQREADSTPATFGPVVVCQTTWEALNED